jgi:phosphatidate cytidylyltransferase
MSTFNEADLFGTREEPKPKRGGRNLWLATIVGLALLVGAVALARYSTIGFAAFVYLLCIAAYPEWKRALARQGRVISLTPIIAATVGIGVSTWFNGREGLIIAVLVGCGGAIAWRLVDDWLENTLHDVLANILTLVWIPFLASFAVLMEQADGGWRRFVIFLVAVVGNDTGGLFVGMLFGQHKMAPKISPKKTWEGAVGGLVAGTLLATAAAWYWRDWFDGRWWIGTIVGVLSVAAAIFGDLAESALKRDIDIKDMSGVLPGHGGVLDRLDGILVAAPIAFVVFALFLGSR